jgi:polyphenol oxidase
MSPFDAVVADTPRPDAASGFPAVGRLPEDPAVVYAFSSREHGNVSFLVGGATGGDARRRVMNLVGMRLGDGVFMEQVHGSAVARVRWDERGRGAKSAESVIPGVDALVTDEPGVALAVLVADCIPLLLADPGGSVAAVHAGRRGVVAGIVPAAVRAVAPERPQRVVALIGPAIGGCCYELPPAVVEEIGEHAPEACSTTRWGTPSVDLPAAVAVQLDRAGVRTVRRTGSCTRCRSDRFFSHRADPIGARAGRQAGIVGRTAVPPDEPTDHVFLH